MFDLQEMNDRLFEAEKRYMLVEFSFNNTVNKWVSGIAKSIVHHIPKGMKGTKIVFKQDHPIINLAGHTTFGDLDLKGHVKFFTETPRKVNIDVLIRVDRIVKPVAKQFIFSKKDNDKDIAKKVWDFITNAIGPDKFAVKKSFGKKILDLLGLDSNEN